MTAEPKLKPCPFCGSEVTLEEENGVMGLKCGERSACHGTGLVTAFDARDKDKAIAAWNRRAIDKPTGATRYIVFERPEGSKCWTVAMVHRYGLPAVYATRDQAETFVRDVVSLKRIMPYGMTREVPMQAHIAAVELPE